MLWAPKGFGKTVAVRIAVGRLLKSNQISGRILIAASELNLTCGTPLLRQLSGKWGAEWGRQLSELFGKATKPVLLLIDQIDNFMMSPEGVKRTQNLIKTLAEDSDLNRNYVVLAVCSCPELATALLDANGRQKITSVSSSISQYKWGAKQIGDLLRKVGGDEAVAGEPWRDALHSSATLAGTPGFLVHHFNHLTDAGSHQVLLLCQL